MNILKDSKQSIVMVVTEVFILGGLSFGADKYIFSFMDSWTWWQFLLMVITFIVIAAISLFIRERIVLKKKIRRNKELSKTVGALQLSVTQEFFKIQMQETFGNNWIDEVKTVVENKFANNDDHKSNYKGIYDILQNEGVETLNEKRMDVTAISSLMLNDFFSVCKVGTNFKKQIETIRNDKNKLVSHISDPDDDLDTKIKELTSIKNIRSFLTYVQNSNWSYANKQAFVDKYQEQVKSITQLIFGEMDDSKQKIAEFESNRRNYLARIAGERAENASEYIPLSYKIDDGTSQRFDLNEIYSNNSNSKGFVIFSKEAGYGKTWSIQELAGLCAEDELANNKEKKQTPILIRMGELAVSGEPIMKAIQEILFPGDESIERTRKYVGQESIVLFIDGMDEADKDNKEPAMRELIKILSSSADVRIIGGTRESDKQWYPHELPRYSICDLSDRQVEDYIEKAFSSNLLTSEQKETAIYDYFTNPNTGFLRNLRSPFYLKCFIDFIKEGESSPDSDTDMMNRCINKMIEREIKLKRFRVTVQLVNDFLAELSKLIGNDHRYIEEKTALKSIKDSLMYDEDNFASIFQIKDTLVELQILKEVVQERQPVLLGFWHEKYKSLFSPVALDSELFDW